MEQDSGSLPHYFWLGLIIRVMSFCEKKKKKKKLGQDLILYCIHQELISRINNTTRSEG